METAYLHEYRCVAECGSFTAAARELHLTQSTLSKHVAALEREFGADLFVRDRSGLKLTAAGEALYAQAGQLEHVLRQTRGLVHAAAAGAAGEGRGERGGRADGAGLAGAASAAGTGARPAASCDAVLRCKCRMAAERYGLDRRETGALVLYLEERGLKAIQDELGLSRDDVADVLGRVYRKLGVSGKQEALDVVHSVSE